MKVIYVILLFLSSIGFNACASYNVFPPKVLKGVDHDFDFGRWRMMPEQTEGKKIQLGGQIIQAEATGDVVTIVVARLPIVDHPAYGPKDNGKNNGEFVITHQGKIQAPFLQPGNRVMVVGTTRPSMVVAVDDLPRSFPTVAAQCLHFWNTQGRDIEDFPFYEAGYVTLEQKTVCASNR